VTCSKIPYCAEQGIFLAAAGILFAGAGKFFGGAGNLWNSPLIGFTEAIY